MRQLTKSCDSSFGDVNPRGVIFHSSIFLHTSDKE
jgi:hypothetical protein